MIHVTLVEVLAMLAAAVLVWLILTALIRYERAAEFEVPVDRERIGL